MQDPDTCHSRGRSFRSKPKPVELTGQVTRVQTVTLDAHQLRDLIAEAVIAKLGLDCDEDQLNITFQYDERAGEGVTGVTIRSEVVETLPRPPVTRGG